MSYPNFVSGDVLTAADMNALGLYLVKTQTIGNGVSAVDVTGAFSTDYDNYVISYSNVDASVNGAGFFFRFGTVASPVTTNYKFGGFFSGYTGTVLNLLQSNPGYWEVGGTNTNNASSVFGVQGPNLAAHSTFSTQFARTDAAFVISGIQEATTQHTAFHLYPSSGTITGGTIRVYGYRN
jgi:hypothetical protein